MAITEQARDEAAACPVCGRPASGEQQCPECGWTLQSPLHAGPLTIRLREEFTAQLLRAQCTLDAQVVARIRDDPGPFQRFIRGGTPDSAQWAAARQGAATDAAGAVDETTLLAQLEDLVRGLRPDTRNAVVEVSADGIAVTRVGLDRFGMPWLEREKSSTWSILLPTLPADEQERQFQLAGGLDFGNQAAIPARLAGVLADLPPGDLLVICRQASWPVPARTASAIAAARSGARLLRIADRAVGVPAGTMLARLTTEAPLRDPYFLAVAEVDGATGEVREQSRQLFAAGDGPGAACRVPLRRPPGDEADTTLAVFSGASAAEPLSVFSLPLPPEQSFDLRMILDGPGRVRIVSPAGATASAGTWAQVRGEIPDRVDLPPDRADLVCAVDLAGPVSTVRTRLRLVRSLLERLAEEYDEPGRLRVSVMTCTDHVFERGLEYQPVVKGTRLLPVADALNWFARQTAAPVTYPAATPLEDLLHEASIMLADSAPGRAARLLLVGGRRPHPYPQGTERAARCPLKYRWRQSMKQLTGHCQARCVAVADAVPNDAALAALWEELGPDGLHHLTATTAQRVGKDLALLAANTQRIPIPLSNPE